MLLSVDENLGRVLELLDKEGLATNTVVVYTSDNGHFLGEHGLYDKRLMYEPSIRVPLLVRFPARAKAGLWWTAPRQMARTWMRRRRFSSWRPSQCPPASTATASSP